MAKIEIILPAMGEGIIEAEITRWLAREGDQIIADEPVVEIATDKVDSEIAAPAGGIMIKILIPEGEVARVGQVLAIIETETATEGGEQTDTIMTERTFSPQKPVEPSPDEPDNGTYIKVESRQATEKRIISSHDQKSNGSAIPFTPDPVTAFISPAVREILRNKHIPGRELNLIKGSGLHGRITRRDVVGYLKNRTAERSDETGQSVIAGTPVSAEKQTVPFIPIEKLYGDDDYEIIEMDRLRKLIADHMVYSRKVSPHVTSFIESDATDLVYWRDRVKDDFFRKYNEKLTYTPLFIEAVIRAIKDFPMINTSVDGYRIIRKKKINIGMATALPSGNLITPVIREADKKNLPGLVKEVNELADRARNNRLKPSEIQGSTFTVTNLGQFDNLTGIPIINQPEVAILAVGAIKKKPAVVDSHQGDGIGIRHIVMLALSYDHRIVDGALGGMFLKKISDYIEKIDINRQI